ncbi:LysE family translocator [Azorhizobium doebereinerae]|uniref:LysE family translocator n=1 Tax=Azorhizobium doebereinerae TaxID=281091 RepID=UPI000420A952|nr:LysE family translocator [Azorhizobium doebereinerae]
MTSHLAEFLTLMAVFALAAVSPGPDFAMVVRQSVVHGRRSGILTSLGIGAAILFHAAYTVAGLGLLVAHSLLAFNILKWAGAAYLVYVGVKTWRAPPPSYAVDLADTRPDTAGRRFGDAGDLTLGFLTNALNPKAVLFFLSIFTTLVSPETPQALQMGYAAGMAGLLAAWFCIVSVFFTGRAVQARLSRIGRWFNRITGGALIGLGLRLALQRASAAH